MITESKFGSQNRTYRTVIKANSVRWFYRNRFIFFLENGLERFEKFNPDSIIPDPHSKNDASFMHFRITADYK